VTLERILPVNDALSGLVASANQILAENIGAFLR
jgi:hypothetical protein